GRAVSVRHQGQPGPHRDQGAERRYRASRGASETSARRRIQTSRRRRCVMRRCILMVLGVVFGAPVLAMPPALETVSAPAPMFSVPLAPAEVMFEGVSAGADDTLVVDHEVIEGHVRICPDQKDITESACYERVRYEGTTARDWRI